MPLGTGTVFSLPADQPLASHIETMLAAWREGEAPAEP